MTVSFSTLSELPIRERMSSENFRSEILDVRRVSPETCVGRRRAREERRRGEGRMSASKVESAPSDGGWAGRGGESLTMN